MNSVLESKFFSFTKHGKTPNLGHLMYVFLSKFFWGNEYIACNHAEILTGGWQVA